MRSIAASLLSVVAVAGQAAELTLHTDFPGGSAVVRRIDAGAGEIEIAPAHHEGRGWPCWWYFRIDGAAPGTMLKIRVVGSEQPFRGTQRLAANWSLPLHAAISTDDIHWQQTPAGVIDKESATYTFAAPADSFWMAWGPPFLPSHAEDLLTATQQRLPGSERFVLAETRAGRPVPGLRIGGDDKPRAVWVQARQHAWESGGSWVGRGFLEWMSGDAPEAIALRETTQIFFVPIMDVDNVALGAGGKEALPRDHNRDWGDEPNYPEVAAAQQQIRRLIDAGRLRAYLDLHNPGPGDKAPFFFGPFQYELLPPDLRRRYDHFLELAAAQIGPPLPLDRKYRFATYVQTEEERGRMSSEWVRRRAGESAVAMTLETAWNTPHSTAEGYQQVGRGLAEALAAYLQE